MKRKIFKSGKYNFYVMMWFDEIFYSIYVCKSQFLLLTQTNSKKEHEKCTGCLISNMFLSEQADSTLFLFFIFQKINSDVKITNKFLNNYYHPPVFRNSTSVFANVLHTLLCWITRKFFFLEQVFSYCKKGNSWWWRCCWLYNFIPCWTDTL